MAVDADVIAAVVIARINPVRDKWDGRAPARPGVAEAFCLRPTASAVGTGQEDAVCRRIRCAVGVPPSDAVCRRLEGRGRFLFDEKDKFI
ncbi:MAG: hypothetical protein IKZ84_03585 [Victivallales bacterium]|nr:hypothetical protein [Victivallales bacterium]